MNFDVICFFLANFDQFISFLQILMWSLSSCKFWLDLFFCVRFLARSVTISCYFVFCCVFCWKSFHFILCKFHSSLWIVWCTNKMTVDEYFVNLVKIIDENSLQSINRSWLTEYLLRVLIDWFDVSDTTNEIDKFNFQQNLLHALAVYYMILHLFCLCLFCLCLFCL